ncbi:hypothetical protein [Halorubrum vacuolatum]|uniref:Uncharacterized protein n=1 Tax=Halorubrum vacuolatum TaxID=63740 RepID=A0A238UQL6_HALVU|nr:hypothetical protein [Halorubrum vacuolatum]SNR24296.1 hypothetical protein SAMN06264855_101247 [Halorubrum vacuolatum]
MTRLTRRTGMRRLAALAFLPLAACIDEPGDGADDGEPDDENGDPAASLTTDVHHVDAWSVGLDWDYRERPGVCLLIEDPDDAVPLLEDVGEGTEAFVRETDFSESALLYVESIGPDACHDRLAFEEFSLEKGTVVGEAAVVGTADDDEVCSTVLTYPRAFVRVTADPLPAAAEITLTDGNGEQGTVRSDDDAVEPDPAD